MLIIPAIDLKDGACVRLRQGRMEDSTVFSDDPVSMAAKWVEGGCRRLHLVDLNGAFEGQPVNGEVVTAIAKRYPTCRSRSAAASARWKPSRPTSRPASAT